MRHRFHAICPYFAMFPETFVEKHLVYSRPDDVVLDPFSGRGTTGFQALLSGRRSLSSDISPVAYCISRAKICSPTQKEALLRLRELQSEFKELEDECLEDPFYQACFSADTLKQLIYLRSTLDWKSNDTDCFLTALILGCLHGESHRSGRYFSNRMPRTIATKPDYSMRWWDKHGYEAPRRDVFEILRKEISYRFDTGRPQVSGEVVQSDARQVGDAFSSYHGQVSLVITSPPYLDTTHFQEDQWLRYWFMGGTPRPQNIKRGDDRHTSKELYWEFLSQSWAGFRELLSPAGAIAVVRIGGSKVSFDEARDQVVETFRLGTKRDVKLKSASSSEIVGGQLRSFRPKAKGTKREHDIVVSIA